MFLFKSENKQFHQIYFMRLMLFQHKSTQTNSRDYMDNNSLALPIYCVNFSPFIECYT